MIAAQENDTASIKPAPLFRRGRGEVDLAGRVAVDPWCDSSVDGVLFTSGINLPGT